MQAVFRESMFILALSLCIAAAVGFARGLPSSAPPANEAVSCGDPADQPPSDAASKQPYWISVTQASALHAMSGVLFLDARPLPQYRAGHVAHALATSVPASSSGAAVDILPSALQRMAQQSTTIITYCDTANNCGDSMRLARALLRAVDNVDVRVLEGGFPAWRQAGLAIEDGPCDDCPWANTSQANEEADAGQARSPAGLPPPNDQAGDGPATPVTNEQHAAAQPSREDSAATDESLPPRDTQTGDTKDTRTMKGGTAP